MLMLGFAPYSELDLNIKATLNEEIEYYYSLDEMYEHEGLGCEYTVIYLDGVSTETLEGEPFYFYDLHDN